MSANSSGTCTTEQFIRNKAKAGWSRDMVRTTLGISRDSWKAMMELIPDAEWAPPNKSVHRQQYYESQRGHCSENRKRALDMAREAATALRRAKTNVTIAGVTLPLTDMYALWSDYTCTTVKNVSWRLRQGQDVYTAFFGKKQKSAIGSGKSPWHHIY